jgi:hypothetical protein
MAKQTEASCLLGFQRRVEDRNLHMFLEGYLDQVGQGLRRETKLTPLRFSSRLF